MDENKYHILIQDPPGKIVAPDGFPANPYPEGAPKVFQDAMKIRINVFCDEQKCAIEPELDEDDPRAWSWVMYESSPHHSEPVATIRIVPPPHGPHPNGHYDPSEAPYIKLTRVATVAEARGRGLNKILIQQAFKYLAESSNLIGHNWKGLVLTHAQVSVEAFYKKLGFVTDEKLGRWDEEGIEHLGMWKQLSLTDPV